MYASCRLQGRALASSLLILRFFLRLRVTCARALDIYISQKNILPKKSLLYRNYILFFCTHKFFCSNLILNMFFRVFVFYSFVIYKKPKMMREFSTRTAFLRGKAVFYDDLLRSVLVALRLEQTFQTRERGGISPVDVQLHQCCSNSRQKSDFALSSCAYN